MLLPSSSYDGCEIKRCLVIHWLTVCWRLSNSKSCSMRNKSRCPGICPYLSLCCAQVVHTLYGIHANENVIWLMWGGLATRDAYLLLFPRVFLLFWGKWAINYIVLFPSNIWFIVLYTHCLISYIKSSGFMALPVAPSLLSSLLFPWGFMMLASLSLPNSYPLDLTFGHLSFPF